MLTCHAHAHGEHQEGIENRICASRAERRLRRSSRVGMAPEDALAHHYHQYSRGCECSSLRRTQERRQRRKGGKRERGKGFVRKILTQGEAMCDLKRVLRDNTDTSLPHMCKMGRWY